MNIAKGRKNMNITEDLAAFCERTAKEREKSINSYCSCPEIKGTKYYTPFIIFTTILDVYPI